MANETKVTAKAGEQVTVIEREFDASRELLFKISTDPKLIPEWWGPHGSHVEVDKADVRTGGEWRFVYPDEGGMKMGFHGSYHEVTPSERIIQTFEWEGMPEKGHVILEKTTLDELPENRTKLMIRQVFMSVEDRDGMIQSGQEKGMKESHERLDALLAKMK